MQIQLPKEPVLKLSRHGASRPDLLSNASFRESPEDVRPAATLEDSIFKNVLTWLATVKAIDADLLTFIFYQTYDTMAKRVKRSAFPANERSRKSGRTQSRMPEPQESYFADEPVGGLFGFFRDMGTRETIESIIVAIVLALMFRAFEAEAFIIPTGSMAPSLQGEHKDLECEECGFRYRVGASRENGSGDSHARVLGTYCPICQYETKIDRNKPDHNSNNGDRILVNKFIYDFAEPQRYDVIVFKNPNNGKQNYIKRLVGMPGDNLLIQRGDIYVMHKQGDGWSREITRKPPHKLKHVLQTVDDTKYIGRDLIAVKWPLRWQEYKKSQQWEALETTEGLNFVSKDSDQPAWLRYRHYRPEKTDWQTILEGNLPPRFQDPSQLPAGRLIGDNYAYNDNDYSNSRRRPDQLDLGLHWVGDIGIECWAEVQSSTGKLLLDLVEGGAHFTCEIDVASGEAKLACDDGAVSFVSASGETVASPVAQTDVKGPGKYHLLYMNADDGINLWVNNRLIKFPASNYLRSGDVFPQYSETDHGDAEPAGVAAQNLAVRLTRLKIVRDIYYTSVKGIPSQLDSIFDLENETGLNPHMIMDIHRDPESWASGEAIKLWKGNPRDGKKVEPMFKLVDDPNPAADQFLPMGDNSPQSSDGRVWDGPNYVERDMLIGRASFIYWPHTLNEPKYVPNFWRMGFIK